MTAGSAEQSAEPTRLFAPTRRVLVGSLLALMTFIAFESYAVTTVLPVVARDLGADQWYSLAFAATIITGLVGMTVAGGWADRRGPFIPLTVGGLVFAGGIAICVAAPTMEFFIVGRLMQGVGGGIDSVVLYVVIAVAIPDELRARMFGLLVAAWLIPSIAGPLVSGVLVSVLDWRSVFAAVLIGSLLSLGTLLAWVRRIPRQAPRPAVAGTPRKISWAVLAAIAVFGLHVAGQRPVPALAWWTLLALLAVWSTASRLLPRGTLRAESGVPRLVALRALLGATAAGTDVYLPVYLQHERGYTPVASGLVIAIGALGWAAGAWLQGRAPTEGRHTLLRWSAMLTVCGPLGALALVAWNAPIAVAVAGCILMGTGLGLAYPQIAASTLRLSPPESRGDNSSALQVAESVGGSSLLAITGATITVAAALGYLEIILTALLALTVAARAR